MHMHGSQAGEEKCQTKDLITVNEDRMGKTIELRGALSWSPSYFFYSLYAHQPIANDMKIIFIQ